MIIKADVQGSIEALQDSLDKMDQSEVRINTIHSAVGAINETDVVLADASNAIIIGFGVRPDGKARSAAEREGVEIRCYDVIYKCLEELDAARIGMLKPTEVEVATGTATVLDTFKVPKVGIAAGVRVEEGEIAATDSVRLVRDGIVVFNGKIARCVTTRTRPRASRAVPRAVLVWRTSRTSSPATRSRVTVSTRLPVPSRG